MRARCRCRGRGTRVLNVELAFPDAALDELVERIAAIVLARLPGTVEPASTYLTVAEAADYLRAKPQRLYDLLSARRLTRFKDGSRVLVARAELDAHLGGVAQPLPTVRQTRTATRRIA